MKKYDKFRILTPDEFYEIRKLLEKLGFRDVYLKREEDICSFKHTPNTLDSVVYVYKTDIKCMLVFYTFGKRNQLMLTFQRPSMTGTEAFREFKRIAKQFKEELVIDGMEGFKNKVYDYFNPKAFNIESEFTSIDQNRCYSYMLMQPVADYRTKTPCSAEDVLKGDHEFYKVEGLLLSGDTVNEIVHRDDFERINKLTSQNLNFYSYESMYFCPKTVKYITDMGNKTINSETYSFYKEVINKFIGFLKANNPKLYKTNSATVHASIYARNKVEMQTYVNKFIEKGYTVMLVKTDAIKIVGDYNSEDNLVVLGDNVGEFKIEGNGRGRFISKGNYYFGDIQSHSGVAKYRQHEGEKTDALTFEAKNLNKEMEIIRKYTYVKGKKYE